MKLNTLRLALVLSFSVCMLGSTYAQVTLGTSPYTENFDGIGTALPTGWTVRTGATASALGTSQSLTIATTAWNSTTGNFHNSASADSPATATDNTATQAANTDRALSVRQTGSFGDAGAAFVLQLANTTGLVDFDLSFSIQQLHQTTAGRTTTWTVDYGFGATPTSFTSVTSSPATVSTVQGTFSNAVVTADFGTALDNNAGPVWIRIAALSATSGTGTRPHTGVDDFQLNYAPSGTNTSVEFATISSTVSEGVGTLNLTLSITDEDGTNDTDVDVVLIVGSAGRINSYTTQTVNFPGGSSSDETLTITVTDNGLCDGDATLTFQLQNITGGQGTPFVGTNDEYDLSITDNDLCTSVEFISATSSGTEGGGTVDLILAITNPSGGNATTVDVALTSGSAADVNSYTTQTATFPAGSSANDTITITITDDMLCEGPESLTFTAQNIAGGQGTPFIGSQATNVLTIADNDAFAAAVQDDFEDGNIIGWNEGTPSDWYASTTSPLGGAYSMRHTTLGVAGTSYFNKAMGAVDLTAGSVSWQWQNGYNNDPSGNNKFWFWIVANEADVTSSTVDGYAVGVNLTGTTDLVTLWKVTNGTGGTVTALITSAFNWDSGDIVGIRVTRTSSGGWELFLDGDGGFDALSSAGTASDATYTTMDHVAQHHVYTSSLTGLLKFDDFAFTSVSCGNTYYSQSSGDVGDVMWSTAMVGTPIAVNFTAGDNMIVQSTHVVTVDNDTYVRQLTVEAGGELDIDADITMHVTGDQAIFDGDLVAADNSELALESNLATVLESSGGDLDLFDLTINTPNGSLTDAVINVRGTLSIEDGDFDASIGALTLVSDVYGTGRLGPVGTGGSYTGDMTVQRYIPAGATNWRFLGSPVAGQTVNEWKDDFITAGFPGSHYPTFDDPVGSGILWPSVREYDETMSYAHIDTGWVGVSNITQSLVQGQGFAAWCGTGLNTTTAFTVDVTGAPYIANTPIDVALSYTNNSAPTIDGWNAVSNPLASPILFSNIARTNVDDYVWTYNPTAGNFATWDISADNGTNGGVDTIQSSQAFMVKADMGSAQIQFEEADKVDRRVGGFFGGDQESTFTGLRLKVTSALNTFYDETLVIFNIGTPELDSEDVPKMTFAHPAAPQIATMAPSGELIAISAFGEHTMDITIPVMVNVALSGSYTVTASNMENLGLSCIMLEDLLTGTMTPLMEGASYSFNIEANDSDSEARLLVHASAPVPFYVDPARCFGNNGAGWIVHIGDSPMDITWLNASNEVILQQTIAEGVAVNSELPAGEYTVRVSSNAGCGALDQAFRIEQPAAMEATADLVDATCPDLADGFADVQVLGGTAPYTYAWSNGGTEEDLVALPGTYGLTVTDANECVFDAGSFVIGAGEAPVASASVESTTVLVDAPVFFDNTSGEMDSYYWEFGDGTNSDEEMPTHSWSEVGTYTVTLTVSNGPCTGVWTTDMHVELTSSIANAAATSGLNAWYANDKFIVAHGFDNGNAVLIDVIDATGRVHLTRRAAGVPARVFIPTETLSPGIWFLRITNGDVQRTVRVPLIR
jgi:hypothetical protein